MQKQKENHVLKRLSILVAALALFALPIAGCGGSPDGTSGSPSSDGTAESSSNDLYSGRYCQEDPESSACLEEVREKQITGAPGSAERAESERELEREEMENQEGIYAPLTH